jgi:UDP-N-acetylglucosamine 2-epimerase (non-hydrolysing)
MIVANLRPNTERPITVDQGTNKLCNIDNLEDNLQEVLLTEKFVKPNIELWDGCTADRVVKSIKKLLVYPG